MAHTTKLSRTGLMISNSITYKRRLDLEDEITSTIWIEITIPKSKPLLIMAGYRQWTLLKEMNMGRKDHHTEQLTRLNILLSKWKKALNENKDTIIMMDDNIDSLGNTSHNTK